VREETVTTTTGIERLTLSLSPKGLILALQKDDGARIEGRLSARLLFYADEQINMHPFGYEDRTGHEAAHQRDPVVFFGRPEAVAIARGSGSGVEMLTLVEERDGFRAELTLTGRAGDPYFGADLRVTNLASVIQRLMVVRLGLEGLRVNGAPAREWTSPPLYKNTYFTRGRVEDILDTDLRLNMPPVGLVQPVVYVGDVEAGGCALEFPRGWPTTAPSFSAPGRISATRFTWTSTSNPSKSTMWAHCCCAR